MVRFSAGGRRGGQKRACWSSSAPISRGSWPRQIVFVLVLVGVLLGLAAQCAYAGKYVIENCPAAPTPNGDPGSWMSFNSPLAAKGSSGGGPIQQA
jgi:hypothetical protein